MLFQQFQHFPVQFMSIPVFILNIGSSGIQNAKVAPEIPECITNLIFS